MRSVLTSGVFFELTSDSVRVAVRGGRRAVALDRIELIEVQKVGGRSDLGHVVFRRRGDPPDLPPAIPSGYHFSGGSLALVFWTSVQTVPPHEQLFDGALTFWFVAHPDLIRQRVQAAIAGVSAYSLGPHR